MGDVSRRDAVRLAAGLAVVGLGTTPARAEDKNVQEPPALAAVFRVEVTEKGAIKFRFDTPGTAGQSFESTEYRYALLDKNGVQVSEEQLDKALVHLAKAIHTADLSKGERSVSDYSDYMVSHDSLRSGEEYYLVVSLRNLTGLAKFKTA